MTAFELPSGKALWTRRLAPASEGSCAVPAPQVCGNAISVLLSPENARRPSRQLLLSTATGEVFDCGSTGAAPDAGRRARSRAGSPVIRNGRVVVERQKGIRLLRSDL